MTSRGALEYGSKEGDTEWGNLSIGQGIPNLCEGLKLNMGCREQTLGGKHRDVL